MPHVADQLSGAIERVRQVVSDLVYHDPDGLGPSSVGGRSQHLQARISRVNRGFLVAIHTPEEDILDLHRYSSRHRDRVIAELGLPSRPAMAPIIDALFVDRLEPDGD